MPELSDVFKDAIGDVPEFDVLALIARQRQHRRMQAAGAAGAVAVAAIVTVTVVAASAGPRDHVSIRTRGSDDTAATTAAPSSSGYFGTTLPPDTKSSTRTTGIAPEPNTQPATTTLPPLDRRGPQAADFTGTLTVTPTTLTVGSVGAHVTLTVKNVSNAVIDPSLASDGADVEMFCSHVDDNSLLTEPVNGDVNSWSMTNVPMQPGDTASRSATFYPTAAEVGTVRCEAVIVGNIPSFREPGVLARIPTIPTVTLTVLPTPDGTTTTVPTP